MAKNKERKWIVVQLDTWQMLMREKTRTGETIDAVISRLYRENAEKNTVLEQMYEADSRLDYKKVTNLIKRARGNAAR